MNKKLLALYGLKYNPFAQEVPVEALLPSPRIESFLWRLENSQVREGDSPPSPDSQAAARVRGCG
jgi:hypothetical protein